MRKQINKAVNTILWKNPPALSSVSIEILTAFASKERLHRKVTA
jgi:hypothetical protein